MFRVVASMRPAGGELHYHLKLLVRRGGSDCVCGVITLHGIDEWSAFMAICKAKRIGVSHEPPAPCSEVSRDER